MLMFLSILAAGLVVLGLTAAVALAADPAPTPPAQPRLAAEPSRFFAGDILPAQDRAEIPLEVALSQIERHIRLEQAAAERFVSTPSPQSLHSPAPRALLN